MTRAISVIATITTFDRRVSGLAYVIDDKIRKVFEIEASLELNHQIAAVKHKAN